MEIVQLDPKFFDKLHIQSVFEN